MKKIIFWICFFIAWFVMLAINSQYQFTVGKHYNTELRKNIKK